MSIRCELRVRTTASVGSLEAFLVQVEILYRLF